MKEFHLQPVPRSTFESCSLVHYINAGNIGNRHVQRCDDLYGNFEPRPILLLKA